MGLGGDSQLTTAPPDKSHPSPRPVHLGPDEGAGWSGLGHLQTQTMQASRAPAPTPRTAKSGCTGEGDVPSAVSSSPDQQGLARKTWV